MSSLGVALVTGASRGIGRAIAMRLAHDGFDVAVNDLASAQDSLKQLRGEITKKGRKAYVSVGDVSVQSDVENMVSSTVGELGQLNVMVANAGICRGKAFLDTEVEEWDKMFSVNGRGIFLCYKYAAKQMIKQGKGGRLIGASSVAGRRGEAGLAAYSSTKFAVRGLTQAASRELASHNITVNAYCPGVIETEMLNELVGIFGAADVPDFQTKYAGNVPLGYNGRPADVASMVSYLASKEAHFITGQSIGIDGGIYN